MTLTNDELTELLDRLLAGWENEVVEFKEAARQFSADKTGEYVSALSNEANLRGLASGWLVFGVSNARQVVGTTHLIDVQQRQTLKHHIHQSIDQGLTVREVYEVTHSGKRVVLLEVPAAPRGIPISWKGDYRARAGESLVPLSLDKLDEIRRQTISADWTAVVVPDATLAHLDPAAIARARQGFTERYASRIPAADIDAWDDTTFLAKARLTRDGRITRAALLLLGADTSTHLLTPHPAQMTWKLVGEQRANEHFRPLEDVLALDRVQKGLDISEKAARHLRRVGLIEGRKPYRRITPRVAAATGAMADYIRTRPQADAHYAAILTDFLRAQGHADRGDVEALLRPALSEALTEQQKATKITNLLTNLRRHGVIINRGTRTKPRWELTFAGDEGAQSEPSRKKDDDAGGTARGPGSA